MGSFNSQLIPLTLCLSFKEKQTGACFLRTTCRVTVAESSMPTGFLFSGIENFLTFAHVFYFTVEDKEVQLPQNELIKNTLYTDSV